MSWETLKVPSHDSCTTKAAKKAAAEKAETQKGAREKSGQRGREEKSEKMVRIPIFCYT